MQIPYSDQHKLLGDINVTPFVDVMLVLLVIFMVTAPLIQQQVEIDLPETQSKHSLVLQQNDLLLTVDKQQRIHLAGRKIRLTQLTSTLKEIYRNKTKKEIFLQADQSIPYGVVVKIMALIKNAGIDRMGMITDSETSSM